MSPVLILLLTQLAQFLLPKLIEWLRDLFTRATENVQSHDTDKVFAEAMDLSRGHPFMRLLLRALHPLAKKIERGEKIEEHEFADIAFMQAAVGATHAQD